MTVRIDCILNFIIGVWLGVNICTSRESISITYGEIYYINDIVLLAYFRILVVDTKSRVKDCYLNSLTLDSHFMILL